MSEMRFDRTMSDAEGLMWRLEKDPYLSSTFATVTILDRPPDVDGLRRRLERAIVAVPRLGQKVRSAPVNLAPPTWVDDPDFDIDHHVRRIACPKPGTLREVFDLAALVMADPLDRARPLWQFVVIEGLRGGRAALVQKMHHSITDGERGVELAMQYLDLERDAPEPPYQDRDDVPHDEGDPTADLIRDVLVSGLRIPLGVVHQVRELLAAPAAIPDATSAAARTLRGVIAQLTETDGARSPLWTQRSLQRRIDGTRAPFRETKDAARKLGGTLNTAFLTAATDAASCYHRELGEPVESLRASMAISTRTETSGANAFSLARMLVPTGEMPIDERFRAIQEAADAAREATRSAGLDAIATVASTLPTAVIARLARQQAQTVDFATSNVKGSPIPVYICGAKLGEVYPIGPLMGVAFNLTLMSYVGSLDMALNIDTAAVQEPDLLRVCLDDAFARLASVSG
jgi:diacylglycerol O-acyltransferase